MLAAAILARLDAIMAELQAIRDEVAATSGTIVPEVDDDDLSEANLLDTHSASARFGYPTNTLAKWCRDEDLGVKVGGRWLVSVPRLRRRLNGG